MLLKSYSFSLKALAATLGKSPNQKLLVKIKIILAPKDVK